MPRVAIAANMIVGQPPLAANGFTIGGIADAELVKQDLSTATVDVSTQQANTSLAISATSGVTSGLVSLSTVMSSATSGLVVATAGQSTLSTNISSASSGKLARKGVADGGGA